MIYLAELLIIKRALLDVGEPFLGGIRQSRKMEMVASAIVGKRLGQIL